MFKVKVLKRFYDMATPGNPLRKEKEIYDIESVERLLFLLKEKRSIEVLGSYLPDDDKYTGPKIIFAQRYLYHIGGIETFLFNFCKHFKDRHITIVVSRAEIEPILALAPYCNIVLDQPGATYQADVCILGNFDCDEYITKVKAKKYYQMIHADWRGIMQQPAWKSFHWTKHPRTDDIICVSQTAADGLKETMGYDSKVIYNILDDDAGKDNIMVFITLSRATSEKGIHRVLAMAKAFKEAGKDFIWYLCCSLDQAPIDIQRAIKAIPEFIILPPDPKNKKMIGHCDYLVQLSDTESFCYSAFEALQRGVPVILTNFTEAYNIVEDGKNGYLVDMDLKNLDIDKIFNHKPTNVTYTDRCDCDMWEKVFKGEL